MNLKETIIEKGLDKRRLIDLLIEKFPDIDNTVKILSLNRDKDVETKLHMRPSKEDKLLYLNEMITQKRTEIEGKNIMLLYNGICQPIPESIDNLKDYEKRFSELIGLIPSKMPDGFNLQAITDLVHITDVQNPVTITEEQLIGKITETGVLAPTFNFLGEVKDPIHSLMTFFFYIHYEVEFLNSIIEKYNTLSSDSIREASNKEFTLARQNLVLHYLLKHSGVTNIDKTNVARLIQLVTGREGDKDIENTRIYRFVKSPFLSDKNLKKDLQFIRPYFENLGLQAIMDDINKEINSQP
jgi:hypothetical protein